LEFGYTKSNLNFHGAVFIVCQFGVHLVGGKLAVLQPERRASVWTGIPLVWTGMEMEVAVSSWFGPARLEIKLPAYYLLLYVQDHGLHVIFSYVLIDLANSNCAHRVKDLLHFVIPLI
jgi:hypothetical protein